MDLRTGSPAVERGTRARSLRGAILARAPSSCPHDHGRLRIPPTPSSRTSSAEKKESTAHRLNRASRPYATPSSNSSFDHDLSDVPTAEDKSAKSNGVNKSAKVVLEQGPHRHTINASAATTPLVDAITGLTSIWSITSRRSCASSDSRQMVSTSRSTFAPGLPRKPCSSG